MLFYFSIYVAVIPVRIQELIKYMYDICLGALI